jgi:hypothetical protein
MGDSDVVRVVGRDRCCYPSQSTTWIQRRKRRALVRMESGYCRRNGGTWCQPASPLEAYTGPPAECCDCHQLQIPGIASFLLLPENQAEYVRNYWQRQASGYATQYGGHGGAARPGPRSRLSYGLL